MFHSSAVDKHRPLPRTVASGQRGVMCAMHHRMCVCSSTTLVQTRAPRIVSRRQKQLKNLVQRTSKKDRPSTFLFGIVSPTNSARQRSTQAQTKPDTRQLFSNISKRITSRFGTGTAAARNARISFSTTCHKPRA